MKSNSSLSGVLHVLLHMAESPNPVTSEVLSRAMRTNPVVVRRTMAGLREAGLVRSEKGHGGGWSIARPLEAITLLDIYRAIGAPGLFALGHRSDNPHCLVEKAVNHALDGAFDAAQTLLLERFAAVTLASLSADFHAGMVAAGHSIDLEHAHAQ
ncbi:Rrf2 family transcriptional regulator [Lysobacter enzymogenes]|uniref:Rrf2 family transcriptional regulator n=1 Tax=Lysobacter enzymogenes TaxID=69 RepID=UPI001A973FA2|nr:Rrf2 family transcriptional regulator [Lysobacter enzymogenes]QQP95459.1 Rrf2 family transcriptional regulator [Lysobacter enzymogenes]